LWTGGAYCGAGAAYSDERTLNSNSDPAHADAHSTDGGRTILYSHGNVDTHRYPLAADRYTDPIYAYACTDCHPFATSQR
jgi:hypothetical protein